MSSPRIRYCGPILQWERDDRYGLAGIKRDVVVETPYVRELGTADDLVLGASFLALSRPDSAAHRRTDDNRKARRRIFSASDAPVEICL